MVEKQVQEQIDNGMEVDWSDETEANQDHNAQHGNEVHLNTTQAVHLPLERSTGPRGGHGFWRCLGVQECLDLDVLQVATIENTAGLTAFGCIWLHLAAFGCIWLTHSSCHI